MTGEKRALVGAKRELDPLEIGTKNKKFLENLNSAA